MNPNVEWRLELAKKIARVYADNPKLSALVVAGSVGRGWADDWSDIELDLFWREPPDDDDRRSVIEALDGQVEYYYPLEDFEWSDAYLVNGVKVEVSGFLVDTIEAFVRDVTQEYDIAIHKQLRLAALQSSIPIHGSDLITAWRTRIARYPDELTRRMVDKYLEVDGWNMVEMLFARDDLLLGLDLMVRVQKNLVVVLHALNHMYLAHPRGKWLDHVAEAMTYKPERFAERIKFALTHPTAEGVDVMDAVIQETFALVEQWLPGVDSRDSRRGAGFRRKAVVGAAK